MIDIIRKLVKQPETTPELLHCMEGMAERNAARIAKIKEEMGTKWILHPSHTKTRLDEPRPV
jgi:hypothetical protein